MLSRSCLNIPSELDDPDLNPLNKWNSMDIRRDFKKESFEDVSEMLGKDRYFLDTLYKRLCRRPLPCSFSSFLCINHHLWVMGHVPFWFKRHDMFNEMMLSLLIFTAVIDFCLGYRCSIACHFPTGSHTVNHSRIVLTQGCFIIVFNRAEV